MRRARRQGGAALAGYIVTWDADSRDQAQCGRLRRFVFGYVSRKNGRPYRYSGFVEREGVRYLGQSVLFLTPSRLSELRGFLQGLGVDHHVVPASVGPGSSK